MDYICANCFDFINPKRWSLGYRLCLSCGELYAKGQPLPKPVQTPPTKEEIKRANELRQIEAEAKKRAAEKFSKERDLKLKKIRDAEMARLKKKYREK